MAKTPGYTINLKLFIPAPKDDFKAQARAAELAGKIMEERVVPAGLIETAKVLDVSAKYGNVETGE